MGEWATNTHFHAGLAQDPWCGSLHRVAKARPVLEGEKINALGRMKESGFRKLNPDSRSSSAACDRHGV
jgi:hypothetical protein